MKLVTRTFKRSDWYITCPYGERINPVTGKKQFHYGCDYGTNTEKCKQYALEDGEVTGVGYNANGLGNYLYIKYPRLNIQLTYGHLSVIYVKKGDKVSHETCIGLTGRTGQATGVHLDLRYKYIGGKYLDPELYDYIPHEETKVTEPVERDINRDQLKVLIAKLRIRKTPSLSGEILAYAKENGIYNDLESANADGYTWHKIADHNWLAQVNGYVELLPKAEFKVGDIVELKEPIQKYKITNIEDSKASIIPITDLDNLIKEDK